MAVKPAFRRVVVKVGSNALAGARSVGLDEAALRRLASEIADLRREGAAVCLVSSGAILAGREKLGLKTRPTTTQLKQAAAAVGQSRLMRAWEAAFSRHGLTVAQVLLTRDDVRDRRRYLNARATLQTLLKLGVVPVVNENDTVSADEIRFGDNDVLSALVAELVDADRLVLLTDQEGLYTADPRNDPSARLIAEAGTEAAQAGGAGPSGSGGMASKVSAAGLASQAGIDAVIASGLRKGALLGAARGAAVGTLFRAKAVSLDKRRRWLAYACDPRGRIIVDAGARQALVGGLKSLLPSGVRAVERRFEAGDVVSLVAEGREFARGLSNYASDELEKIMGRKTSEIEGVLGRKAADEVVHRDNLAVLE
jgi:glutamate 5-kinase